MGWGMATATYPARKFMGMARIRLYSDGKRLRAVGAAASQDLGTGTWTIGTQMVASLTGLPLDQVKFELGDSSLPTSGVSGGSTTAASVGQAMGEAGDALIQELLALAQAQPSSPLGGLAASQVQMQGNRLVAKEATDPGIDLVQLIAQSGKPYIEGTTVRRSGQPNQGGSSEPKQFTFTSFGAHFVEVLIEDPVPRAQVNRIVSVMNVGKVLNPITARSQVMGGAIMGVGMALMEETLYDPRTARPMSDNLADYHVCVNPDIREFEAHFVDIPDTNFSQIGARGLGEIGITGVAAAVANAVYHATGKRIRDLPITPDKLL